MTMVLGGGGQPYGLLDDATAPPSGDGGADLGLLGRILASLGTSGLGGPTANGAPDRNGYNLAAMRAALGKVSGASRLPITNGQVFGALAEGQMGGEQAYQQALAEAMRNQMGGFDLDYYARERALQGLGSGGPRAQKALPMLPAAQVSGGSGADPFPQIGSVLPSESPGRAASDSLSLAERLNNPGNLKAQGALFDGEGEGDSGFGKFATTASGFRGLAKNLMGLGVDSIGAVAAKWAPDDPNYARKLSMNTGIPLAARIDLTDPATVAKLTAGITKNESPGKWSPADMIAGVNAAVTGQPLPQSTQATGAILSGMAGARTNPTPGTQTADGSGQIGYGTAPAQPATQPSTAPLLIDPRQLLLQAQRMRVSPSLAAQSVQLQTLAEKLIEAGKGIDASGNIVPLPGALTTAQQQKLAESLGTEAGKVPYARQQAYETDTGKNQAAIGNGYPASAATAGGTEAGKLTAQTQFGPAATLAIEGPKTYLDILKAQAAPRSERAGNVTVVPPIPQIPGMTIGGGALLPGQALPSGDALPAPGAPVSGQTVVHDSAGNTIFRNSSEQSTIEGKLGEQYMGIQNAAVGAPDIKSRFLMMRDQLDTAILGANANERSGVSNFLATYVPGVNPSDPKVTASQVFDKLATQVAGEQTKQLDQTAVSALNQMKSAYPNRQMNRQALIDMTGQLAGYQDWLSARAQAAQDYRAARGTIDGFNTGDWAQHNPPTKYALPYLNVEGVKSMTATPQSRQALFGNLQSADLQRLKTTPDGVEVLRYLMSIAPKGN